ncbi:hypothetical protein ACFL0V_06285 [Nanoarchaeota archaeon]
MESEAAGALSKAKQQLENRKKSLAELEKELEDCLKLCVKYAKEIAQGTFDNYDDLADYDKPKPVVKAAPVVTTPAPAVTTPAVTPPTSQMDAGPKYDECKDNEFKSSKCDNSCEDHQKCEWFRTLDNGDSCFGCGNECEVGEWHKDEWKCEDECDTVCVKKTFTDCYFCAELDVDDTDGGSLTCEEVCEDQGSGWSDVKPSHKDWIMGEVNGEDCKEWAQITYPNYRQFGECNCYPSTRPTVTYGPTWSCEDTSCGEVACKGSAECSCGTDCIVHVNCNWNGWKWSGSETSGGPEPDISVDAS